MLGLEYSVLDRQKSVLAGGLEKLGVNTRLDLANLVLLFY